MLTELPYVYYILKLPILQGFLSEQYDFVNYLKI